MYQSLLAAHSILRWAVVVLALLAGATALSGWSRGRPRVEGDRRIGSLFVLSLDLQLAAGLALYVAASPVTTAAWRNLAVAMTHPLVVYWTFVHPGLAILAVVLGHVGQARSKRLEGVDAQRTAAVFFWLAAIATVAAVPWPWLPVGRPLLRL